MMEEKMNAMPGTVERGPLDADAARFLENFGAALALPATGVRTDAEIAAYLTGERARLNDSPGTSLLRPNARGVATQDHRLAEGVDVRSYVPEGASQGRPIVVYLHGGGFVSGSVNLNDSTCRILAAEGDLVVVSVGYRLAPEYPYPVPLDDSDRALRWAHRVGRELFGADPSRLAVAGGSAGGALAAALALRTRDRGDPEIALQVLIYPVLDSRMTGASYAPDVNGRDYFISAEQMAWYWARYRGPGGDLDADPYFSPAAAPDLSGLPRAIIVTAEFDVLRDEGTEYHERLLASGVPVAADPLSADPRVHDTARRDRGRVPGRCGPRRAHSRDVR